MITKSGGIIFASRLFQVSTGNVNPVVDMNGATKTDLTVSDIGDKLVNIVNTNNFASNVCQMRVGIGDNEPSVNDYNLTDTLNGVDVNTLFELSGAQVENDAVNGTYNYRVKFKYTGADPITIKECGLFFQPKSNYRFMLMRNLCGNKTLVRNEEMVVKFSLNFNSIYR